MESHAPPEPSSREPPAPSDPALQPVAAGGSGGSTAPPHQKQPWVATSLQQLRAAMRQFAEDRDWQQFHTPRQETVNLLLALVGETGELSECFQWKGEVAPGLPGFSSQERRHVGEELSDVLLYLVRLSDVCGIDLAAAVTAKLASNAAKYPAHRCRGSSAKYTQYTQISGAGAVTDAQQADGAEGRQSEAEDLVAEAGQVQKKTRRKKRKGGKKRQTSMGEVEAEQGIAEPVQAVATAGTDREAEAAAGPKQQLAGPSKDGVDGGNLAAVS
ncbi:dCTP pyrophosphatase 1 [Chlorella vulgaris]